MLPSHAHRFTVTVWYFDGAEKARADEFAKKAAAAAKEEEDAEKTSSSGSAGIRSAHNAFAEEDERIRSEIKKFEEQQAVTNATSSVGDGTALVIDDTELAASNDAELGATTAGSSNGGQLSLDSDDELPEGAYLGFEPTQRSELVSEHDARRVPNVPECVRPRHDDENATATATANTAEETFFDRTMQATASMQAQLRQHQKQQSEIREEFGEDRIDAWRREHESFLDGRLTAPSSDRATRADAEIHGNYGNVAGATGKTPGSASPEELQAAATTPTRVDCQDTHDIVADTAPDVQEQLDDQHRGGVADARVDQDETDLFELD